MLTRNLKYNAHGTVDMEIEHPNYGWIPFTASLDDSELLGRELHAAAIAGTLGAIAAADPPPALTAADFDTAVDSMLLTIARSRGYRSVESCVSYVGDSNPVFAAEAAAFKAYRSTIWTYCTQQLALVQAGARSIPASTAAFIAELPLISW